MSDNTKTEINEIIQIGIDAYNNNVDGYSVKEATDALRNALIAANCGSTKLNYKNIRDGKCPELFSIVETILDATIEQGLSEDDFFNSLVDFRNIASGDENVFSVEDSDLFVISEAADGTQSVRRQRLGGKTEVSIPTTVKMVRIYEELSRVLSNKIDFNEFIYRVSKSYRQKMLNDVYSLWASATAADFGGNAYFPAAGSFSEDALLDVVEHVEAAAGKTATIIGTKKALRKLNSSIKGIDGKNEIDRLGYAGTFYGSPVVALPQRHKIGTTNFVFDDKTLYIVAGDDKPIKFVREGDPLIIMSNPLNNADLTQEYVYGEKYGMGIVLSGGNTGIGRYTTTN